MSNQAMLNYPPRSARAAASGRTAQPVEIERPVGPQAPASCLSSTKTVEASANDAVV